MCCSPWIPQTSRAKPYTPSLLSTLPIRNFICGCPDFVFLKKFFFSNCRARCVR